MAKPLKFTVRYVEENGLFAIVHKTKRGVIFHNIAVKGELNDAFNQLLKAIKEEAA